LALLQKIEVRKNIGTKNATMNPITIRIIATASSPIMILLYLNYSL
jgi:hypothetical protein